MLWAPTTICLCIFSVKGNHEAKYHIIQPKYLPSLGDVSVGNTHFPTSLRLRLRKSKTDQLGNGVDVYVGRTDSPLCLVGAFTWQLVALIQYHSVDFWIDSYSSLHNKCVKYCKHWASPIQSLLDTARTIAVAKARMEDSDSNTYTLGRWNSLAFLTCICTLQGQLAQFSKL